MYPDPLQNQGKWEKTSIRKKFYEKIKKIQVFPEFLKIISLKVESLRAFLSIMIQNFQNAYIPHPKISQLKRGAKKLNFQPNMVLETCHIFSMKKILPSFNIGVVIALIHCLICLYRGKETKETEKNNVSIRHGSLILAFLRLFNMQIFQRKKMTCQKKQALMLSKGHKSAIYTQNEKETTSMYSLKEFFKSCECRVKCLKTEVKGFHQEVDFSQVYNLKQFFKSCNYSLVPQYSQVETVSQCENGVKASDSDEEYDIRDHLDTVPLQYPEPLNCEDYMYYPSHCGVIFNASQNNTNFQTASSQNSLLEQENQQLKLKLCQLQSEYNSLKAVNMGLGQQHSDDFKCSANDKVQIANQHEDIVQLKDLLVTLKEKYDKVVEHNNLVCDKYNEIIPQLENANLKISELQQTVKEQDSLVCDKCTSIIPKLKKANHKISKLEKTVKDLHHDNYLLNNVLEKTCPDSSNYLNSSTQSNETGTSNTPVIGNQEEYAMVVDSISQTDFISFNSTNSSKSIYTDSGIQTNLTQTTTDSYTQTKAMSYLTSSSPKDLTKSAPSRGTSPQPNTPISQLKITANYKRFKCAWCSEEKHPWDKCQQWNSWNLWQKQQALLILDNVKKGKLPPNMSTRPHIHSKQKLSFHPTQVKINRENISKVQWENQMKINENIQNAGLVKISSSYYVQKGSAVIQRVESLSLRRSQTTSISEKGFPKFQISY